MSPTRDGVTVLTDEQRAAALAIARQRLTHAVDRKPAPTRLQRRAAARRAAANAGRTRRAERTLSWEHIDEEQA